MRLRTCLLNGVRRECMPCVSADLSPLISRLRDSFPPRGSLLYAVRTWQIWLCIVDCLCDPPSSVAYAIAPPQGEAFCTLCEHGGRGKNGRYGKYHFVLWFAFAIRPHPSPTATPSPSKGKASDRSANLKKSALGIRHFRHLHLEFQAFVRCQHFKVKTKEVCTKPSPSRGKVSPKATDEGVPL